MEKTGRVGFGIAHTFPSRIGETSNFHELSPSVPYRSPSEMLAGHPLAKAPLLNKNHSKHSQTSGYWYNWHPESEYCDRWTLIMSPRSFQVNQGHQTFSEITFDRDKLGRWKHHRCVQTDDADRMICNMTFSGQAMTLTWGQTFNMTLQGQIAYHSTRLDKRNMMLPKEMLCLYWVKSYYRKTAIAKRLFF